MDKTSSVDDEHNLICRSDYSGYGSFLRDREPGSQLANAPSYAARNCGHVPNRGRLNPIRSTHYSVQAPYAASSTMYYFRATFGSTCCEIGVEPSNDGTVSGWALRVEPDNRLSPLFDDRGCLIKGSFRTTEEALRELRRLLTVHLGPEQSAHQS